MFPAGNIGGEKPGVIRYFDESGAVAAEETVALPNATDVEPPMFPAFNMRTPAVCRTCSLGSNLYSADRRKNQPGKPAVRGENSMPLQKNYEPKEEAKAQAKAELNALAGMLGGGAETGDNFNVINLFPD